MTAIADGNFSHLSVTRGSLREYTNASDGLELHFEFNPSGITRSREVDIKFGKGQATNGGGDFKNAKEAPRVAQKATVKAESFTVKIMLDATDRMNAGDPEAQKKGIQPELDILCYMIEPKLQKPGGAMTLAALSRDSGGGQQPFPSVLLFSWGSQTLPVLMTKVQFDVKEYLPNLVPYRAEATLSLQVIQSNNKYYNSEIKRVFTSAQQAKGSVQGYRKSD